MDRSSPECVSPKDGYCVSRKRVRRLMAKMGLRAVYQMPRTTAPHPEHLKYPYLLGNPVIDRPIQDRSRRHHPCVGQTVHWTVWLVKRSDIAQGLEVIPRRRVVERPLAWLGRCRRMAKDRKKTVASAEAWLLLAHIRRVTRLLARASHLKHNSESDSQSQRLRPVPTASATEAKPSRARSASRPRATSAARPMPL